MVPAPHPITIGGGRGRDLMLSKFYGDKIFSDI